MRIATLLGIVALSCSPAFAEEGNLSPATLKALGLGGAEVISDAQGMQVRGMAPRVRSRRSSYVSTRGTSLISGQLVDPATPNLIAFSFVDSASVRASTDGAPITATQSNGIGPFSIVLSVDVVDPPSSFFGSAMGSAGGRGTASTGFLR